MYKIGITGSIGTGKTTVANIFAMFNIPIFDADKEIKELFNEKKVNEEVKKVWPKATKNGHVDKLRLKKIIFSDKREKKRLEKLLYPYLQIKKDKFEEANHSRRIVAHDVPLIYETKSEKNYDLILLTYCDPELQKKRVLNRDKISTSLYEKIVKSQLSFKEKKTFKPKIINTNNSKQIIFIKIVLLLTKILIKLRIRKWKKKES